MNRTFVYLALIICFLSGVFIKQFSLLYAYPFVHPLLVAIAFCGAIGLLLDYTARIRTSAWALVPALLALEMTGDLISGANFRDIAFWFYIPGALLFVVYAALFIRRGIQLQSKDRSLGLKLIVLGLLSGPIVLWEYATYFPATYQTSHIGFRILYLAVFAWLLFIDFSTDFALRPQLKIEKQILRLSLLVIAGMYFVRFVFK
ncbi:MAG TPA: hypothetical protein ENJ82_02060 [Bacteroidetes bacterium]|nr:hypothetical protein [Bacteroidota bacterium]